MLLAAVVGSGIMAERLFPASSGLALLANTLATGAALIALILALVPLGSELNPVVTMAISVRLRRSGQETLLRVLAQILGAFVGVAMAHLMFSEPWAWSAKPRAGVGMFVSEIVATFGLVLIALGAAARIQTAAISVSGFVVAGYWFTASTCFANPAVTLARSATNTFTGIRPADVPVFLLAELIGAAGAGAFYGWAAPNNGETK